MPWWLSLWRRRLVAPVIVPTLPASTGFAEDISGFSRAATHVERVLDRLQRNPATSAPPEPPAWITEVPPPDRERPAPFPSTGPHGHRKRMRDKLLSRGPDALADYELLEMLLFGAQPRGDTKPLAKALINRFGSFAAVLSAPERDLLATPGLGPHSVAAIKLVHASAVRLTRAEVMDRPILGNMERLTES